MKRIRKKSRRKILEKGDTYWRLRYSEAELTIARAALEINELEDQVKEITQYRAALESISKEEGVYGDIARSALNSNHIPEEA